MTQATNAEARLAESFAFGALVDLRPGNAEARDPAAGAQWDHTRTVRAEALIELIVRTESDPRRAIRLRGARISGALNLDGVQIDCPIALLDCFFDEPVSFVEASARSIRLGGSHLPKISARQLQTSGDLSLDAGCTVNRTLNLEGAHIGGSFDCRGGRFRNRNGPALTADGLSVDQDLLLQDGFEADSAVRLLGAHIKGAFNCSGGWFRSLKGPTLYCDFLKVDYGMFCQGRQQGSKTRGFKSDGEVSLIGAHIGGQFDCDGGKFHNPSGPALSADGLTVDQDMLCTNRFEAEGEVRLLGAHIGGQLNCTGGKFRGTVGLAINAGGLTVDQDVLCMNGFEAEGGVRLLRAHIGGRFQCTNGKFRSEASPALDADLLTVDQDMLCGKGFESKGAVSLMSATIHRNLDFEGARLQAAGTGPALKLRRANVAGSLALKPGIVQGIVDLAQASVGVLDDDPRALRFPLNLDGLAYDDLATPLGAKERCEWLNLNPTRYSPQPFEQLAATFRRQGEEEDARTVLIEKRRRRRQVLPPWRRQWDWVLDYTVLYGYETWRAAGLLLLLWALGGVAFHFAWELQLLSPALDPRAQPDFHASLYSLDLIIPVLSLHQFDVWVAHGWALWAAIGLRCAGWVLTTLAVLSLTGIFKGE